MSSASTSPSTCSRVGQRDVSQAHQTRRVQLVNGRAEALPFPDSSFDALTFTYLLRYVDDPRATLKELARVVKPGGVVASLEFMVPPSPFWRFWWWGYTRFVLPVGGLAHRRAGVVPRRALPRAEHLGALSAVPGGLDGRRLGEGRFRGRRHPPDEPRRGTGDVGPTCLHAGAGPDGRARPSTPPAPVAGATGGSSLHPPYTGWHLSYVVIGACLAPKVNTTRLLATLLAFFFAVGIAAHALDELNGRPLRTRIRSGYLVAAAAVGLGGAVVIGVLGVARSGLWLVPFIVFGPLIVVAYNAELFGGLVHNDAGFAAGWGAFPVLTAYVGQTDALALAPVLAALAAFALSVAQRRLSTPARALRRRVERVEGTVTASTGAVSFIDREYLLAPLEGALRALAWSTVLFAAGLAVARLVSVGA